MVAESPRAQILKHITWTHSLIQDFTLSQNHTHKQTGTNVKEDDSIRSDDGKWLYGHLEFGRHPTAVVPTTSQVIPMKASNILTRVKDSKYNLSLMGLNGGKYSWIQYISGSKSTYAVSGGLITRTRCFVYLSGVRMQYLTKTPRPYTSVSFKLM